MKADKHKNLITGIALAVVMATVLALWLFGAFLTDKPDRTPDAVHQPHVVKDGEVLYANTAKDVKFVGSEACEVCHPEISATYFDSEMGQSMQELTPGNVIERYPQQSAVYDSGNNFHYEMLRQDDRFYQREYRLTDNGEITHERWLETEYAIGSGNNLRMYFHDENGMFYQLPLTWYVHENRWDLSPGYRDFNNLRFSRYVTAKCLGCHNSFLQVDPNSTERYEKPYRLGIGCERCHGPGELHVRQMQGDSTALPHGNVRNIVNPRKLSPQRQLDVCRQCHLQGKAWALRGESGWFDFRPGMLLETHRSVYTTPDHAEVFEVAGSAERLVMSRCFTASGGRLTCITCHDPHRSIKTFSIDHYNQKCLDCHPREELAEAQLQTPHIGTENCVACHMNRTGTDNTLHGVSNTDHWIRIGAINTQIDWATLRLPVEKKPLTRLVPLVDARDEGRTIRRGIAYYDYYNIHDNRRAYLDSALTNLQRGLTHLPADANGFYYLGKVRFQLGDHNEAIAAFEQATGLQTGFADAWFELGKAYFAQKRIAEARTAFEKALQLKPDVPEYLENLGAALAKTGRDKEAALAYERAISIDKQNGFTYYTLGNLYALKLNRPQDALKCYQRLVTLEPDFPNGYLNLGNVHLQLGNIAEALAAYRKEIRARPNSPLPYVNLGRIYERQGKIEDAKRALSKALEIDPDFGLARQLLNRLQQP